MGNKKHYAERDIIEQGEHYTNHVMALTAEGLHGKSEIAAELAHRDQRIAALEAENAELRAKLERLQTLARPAAYTPVADWVLLQSAQVELRKHLEARGND